MPIPTDSERIGTTIDNKYRVESLIGRGGMGTVFRATHTWTNRAVALKILQPQYAENGAVVLRFLREARAAASFRHPNVVEVLDMGALPEGGAYMALAFLDGESLASVLERSARLSVEEAFVVLIPVMRALSLAHSKGIVHRDIKPDNLFLARNDEGATIPTLLDFGIAKLDDASGKVTTTGVIFGTPQYMSPEQARGVADIDGRADVWSMAAVWFECLTGQPPFDAPVPTALIARLLSERAPFVADRNPAIPAAIAAAVDRGLEPDRDARYPTMDAFVDALLAAAEQAAVRTTHAVIPVRHGAAAPRSDAPGTLESASTVQSLATAERSDPKTTMDAVVTAPRGVQRSAMIAGALAFVAVLTVAWGARMFSLRAAPPRATVAALLAVDDATAHRAEDDATAHRAEDDASAAGVARAVEADASALAAPNDAASLAQREERGVSAGRPRARELVRAAQDAGGGPRAQTAAREPNASATAAGSAGNTTSPHTIGVTSNY